MKYFKLQVLDSDVKDQVRGFESEVEVLELAKRYCKRMNRRVRIVLLGQPHGVILDPIGYGS